MAPVPEPALLLIPVTVALLQENELNETLLAGVYENALPLHVLLEVGLASVGVGLTVIT